VADLRKEIFFDPSQAGTVRRVKREAERWSPPADGQIIAQKFIKPIVCHAMYDVVSGGILNGIVGGDDERFDMSDLRTANIVSDRLPVDYPLIDMNVRGWTYAYFTNEYWVRNNVGFIIGAPNYIKPLKG